MNIIDIESSQIANQSKASAISGRKDKNFTPGVFFTYGISILLFVILLRNIDFGSL